MTKFKLSDYRLFLVVLFGQNTAPEIRSFPSLLSNKRHETLPLLLILRHLPVVLSETLHRPFCAIINDSEALDVPRQLLVLRTLAPFSRILFQKAAIDAKEMKRKMNSCAGGQIRNLCVFCYLDHWSWRANIEMRLAVFINRRGKLLNIVCQLAFLFHWQGIRDQRQKAEVRREILQVFVCYFQTSFRHFRRSKSLYASRVLISHKSIDCAVAASFKLNRYIWRELIALD